MVKCSSVRSSSPSTISSTATVAAVVSILRCTRPLTAGSREAVISRNGTSASFGPIPISRSRKVSIAPAAVMDVSSISVIKPPADAGRDHLQRVMTQPARCFHDGLVTEHYDVIIVGSGAGGGTLAHTLAPSGKRILLLERGDFLPRETDNWNPKPVFVEGKYISKDTWFDGAGQPFQPQVHYFVGGATKLYGAALYRLRPRDFAEFKHVDGISPAWPLSYDDFEPWYTKAERLYQVHGNAGEDPTEGPRSAPYPWPAVSHEPRIQQISEDLVKGGYHPFHAPCGILLNEAQRSRSTCIRCTWCDGYPCLVHAKSDAEVIAVRPLLDRENLTLLTGAEVTKLETDDSGRMVTGVVVSRDGNQEVYRADIVAVSAGAANSAKLLLNSATDRHPRGLANGSDQVGRNYMFHNCKAVVALVQGEERHRLPEDAGDQRFLLRRERL